MENTLFSLQTMTEIANFFEHCRLNLILFYQATQLLTTYLILFCFYLSHIRNSFLEFKRLEYIGNSLHQNVSVKEISPYIPYNYIQISS